MSKILIDTDELAKLSSKMRDFTNQYQMRTDNVIWSVSLPTYEQLMLKDMEIEFMSSLLGLDIETFNAQRRYSQEFSAMRDFYENEAKRIASLEHYGFIESGYSKYDPNLTLEQAVQKYLGSTIAEATTIYNNISRADDECAKRVASVRQMYNGNLGILIGKDENEYIERAYQQEEATKKAISDYTRVLEGQIGPRTGAIAESINQFSQMLESQVADFGTTTPKKM